MEDESQERGDTFDDLFEDLDQFFTPGEPGQAARRPRAQGSGGSDRSGEDSPSDPPFDEPSGSEPHLGEDILPAGWEQDIAGLDVEGVTAGPPDEFPDEEAPIEVSVPDPDLTPPSYASTPEGPGSSGPDGPGHEDDDWELERPPRSEAADQSAAADDEEDQSVVRREPTAEMSGEDWRRLRDAVGDEDQGTPAEIGEIGGDAGDEALAEAGEPDFAYRPEEPAWEQPAEQPEDRHELTLEDLKKPPPEYQDLPAAPEDVEPVPVESWDQPVGASWEPGSESDQPPAWASDTGSEPAGAGADETDTGADGDAAWDEPDMADVEAAADQLASEYGDVPGPAAVEQELLADLDQPSGPRTVKVGETERLSGPTWEEPGSQAVLGEPATAPAPFGGRNLPLAVLTGLGLAALALISLAFSKAAFVVVAGAVVLFGQAELYATMHRRGHQPATALGLVVGGFMLAGAYLKGEPALAFFLALGLFLSFLWYMAAAPKAREGALYNIASTMLGVLYVPFFAGYLLIVLAQPQSGKKLMLAVLGFTFIYDTAAFVIGSFWGSRALASTISPRKSWEGLFGATVVTFALAVAILPSIEPLTVVNSVGLALVIIVFAPLGDLAESAMKRDLGVKDMGSILPGHGGVLDRIDSVLLVAPAAFYYLRLIL